MERTIIRDSIILVSCLLMSPLVVQQCFAQTAQTAQTATDTGTTSTPAQTSTPAAASGSTSIDPDPYIPGSEMLPAPQKSKSESEDFVKNQNPTMDLALVLYKNNEYRQALVVLEKLKPTEQTHYYQGLCYKGLGNQREAEKHFAWVAYYARDPKLKSYAFAAIRSFKPTKPTKVDRGGSTSTMYSSTQAGQRSEELVTRIRAQERSRAKMNGRPYIEDGWGSGSRPRYQP